jgi:exodeoxyribonuclease VII small subunit
LIEWELLRTDSLTSLTENGKRKTENGKTDQNPMAKEKKPPEPSFEAGLKRLEEVLDSLEHGDLSLEEAMSAFEEGVQLVRVCHKKLDEVEKRVELLLKDDAGRFFTRPFLEEEG